MKYLKLFEQHYTNLEDFFSDKINKNLVNDVVDYLLRFEDRGKICFFSINVSYDVIGSIQIYSHTNWDKQTDLFPNDGWCDNFVSKIKNIDKLIDGYTNHNGEIFYKVEIYDTYIDVNNKSSNTANSSELFNLIKRKYDVNISGNFDIFTLNESYISHSTGLYDVKTDKIIELRDMQLYWDNIKVCDKPNYIESKEYKELSKFLRENKNGFIRMYHGTGKSVPILGLEDRGLLKTTNRTKKSFQSETGYVYLSVYPESAKTFGEICYPYDKPAIIYEVVIPVSELRPDTDQLRNARQFGNKKVGDTLVESLVIGHGARVKGHIPKYMINIYKEK